MRLNDYYHDRGVQKYNGFFLSEHTADLNKEQKRSNQVIEPKEQQSEELIFELIDFSIFKSKRIAIQLNIKDAEGYFFEDLKGTIQGYDESNIYLGDNKIPLNQIRHVTELETKAWYI